MTNNYAELDEFLKNQYSEMDGYDFYRYIFPDNENSGEYNTDFSKPNAIYLYQDERDEGSKRRLRRRIMLKDTWKDDYIAHIERNPLTLCSGLSYRKMANKLNNAQRMHALIFDLDGVGGSEIINLFMRFRVAPDMIKSLPLPTFLVLSGKGLHLYYVFKEPIDLYPNIKLQLKSLKYDLTQKIWDYKSTSQVKQIQYQSINQSFRMVGSVNSKYSTVVKAYQVGKKITIDYLNQYVINKKNAVDLSKPFKPSKMTKEEAKEAYPEWYERVIEGKHKNLKKWDIKGKQGYALYEWWKRQYDQIVGGHRYYFLMCMAIYACKCDVPKAQLRKDMNEMFYKLADIKHDNPLLKSDITSALEAYDKEYYNFTINDIEKLTNVRIKRNKRNGRTQSDHIKLMNFVRDEINGNKNWREGNGRPKGSSSAKNKVYDWRQLHPNGKKIDCERETGLSRHTVLKWWEYIPLKKVDVLKTDFNEVQQISKNIVAECKRIASENNISEEAAYELYKQDRRNVQLIHSVPVQNHKKIQKQSDRLIFSESEYLSLPVEFHEKIKSMGIRPRVVADEDYDITIAEEFLEV